MYIFIQVWTIYSAESEGPPTLSHSYRSPRANMLISCESLAKFMRYSVARFLIFCSSGHFSAKLKNHQKWWHLSIFHLTWTFKTAFEASCPKKLKSFDRLKISLELRI